MNFILNFLKKFRQFFSYSNKTMSNNSGTSSTAFSLKLANHVLQEEIKKGSNSAISPLSFHVMLSLIAAGSTGRTLEQLLSHLESDNVRELNLLSSKLVELASKPGSDANLVGGPLVSFVNGAWVDQSVGLNVEFESVSKEFFNTHVKEVDFVNKADEVRKEVNSWAESNTKGLIKEVLPSGSLEQNTVLVLANALYFKGAWHKHFDESKTKIKEFHCLNGEKLQVPFMTSAYGEKHFYKNYNHYKVLQIPYKTGNDTRKFSMYFFLPNKTDGLQTMLDEFSSNTGFYNQEFDLQEEELFEFWIPRFKFTYEFEASSVIKKLGLDRPFMDTGELNGMVNSPGQNKLCVSKMFHKLFIEVNEEGTEASASTAAAIVFKSASFPTVSFVADHPFVFMVREETSKAVFFVGAVVSPS